MKRSLERLTLLGPGLGYLTVLMVVPLALVLSYTIFQRGRFGGLVYEPTTENFLRAVDPLYLDVLVTSVEIAGVTTVLALLLGFPTAYVIARLPGKWKTIALVGLVLPFWTNFLIRTYAWIVLLSPAGMINDALTGWGLIDEPLQLLYTKPAIVAGLLYAYLPLMVLPLFAALEKQDDQLLEAAANLGARPAKAFLTVTLPLTLPAVITGCVFVFVPSIGNFVVPELLGGGQTAMVGNLIRDQFLKARDWPFGATLALILVAMLMLLLMLQAWSARRLTGDKNA
ncbi:spermidine/putrescine transport system permease protein [Actinoplanes lutulentus]|uniref:Spermidine/putrescine transport system permease protein n=1 Tax=Actinoplanes lutulentus TaxID=1287878 RepID=A0A327YY61_9ACTN|nr:ABC transporter permease [Actinoplanes lutulentus]MBB2943092.1 spermidine/putrescine transport system permease protein [Actinoplanes lutulentus]RAK26642.1 spermidine/putrescine transport system permease protein [Actinoplanes lutulentus]